MSSERIHAGDTLKVTVAISQGEGGPPRDLTGFASDAFEAVVGRPGGPVSAGTVTILDPPSEGRVLVAFEGAAIACPSVLAQLRHTSAGETQTVWAEEFPVAPSLFPA